MPNTYRELTAPELVTWFAKITSGYIIKGRDAHAISFFMQNRALTPCQMLAGMVEFAEMPDTKDVPTFLRVWDEWLEDNVIVAEAIVAKYLTGQEFPVCYWRYMDLENWDIDDALVESNFRNAKKELELWLNDALDKPATIRSGSRSSRISNKSGPPYPRPGKRSDTG